MKERGSGIKDHPFTDKKKFPPQLEIQSLVDTEVWGKDQKTLQLGWTQQGKARSKYPKTALIDKHQKPQYHRGVSGTLLHTVPNSSYAGTKTIPDETFVHSKSGDFGAISVTERSCAAPIVERHLSDRLVPLEQVSGPYRK